MLEPTINGDKLIWTDGKHRWTLTGVPVVVPGPEEPPPPPPPPPSTGSGGIWLSRAEIERLPMSGAAWEATLAAANKSITTSDLNNQDSENNVVALAKGLVYARTGNTRYRDDVLKIIQHLIATGASGRTLALGRELAAYVVAADLVELPADLRSQFEAKLRTLRTQKLEGKTLIETHEGRPNNWGTMAGASRAAVAAYLGDKADLERTATVFRGWLGDRSAYAGFKFGDLGWQPDPKNPVAVGLPGATGHGQSLDGALPEELRRAGGYNNYVWGALSGAVAQAWFLHRQGYPAFEWMQKAILRAVKWPHDLGKSASGDDAWLVAVTNQVYGRNDPVTSNEPGKVMGWTQWTHASTGSATASTSSGAGR